MPQKPNLGATLLVTVDDVPYSGVSAVGIGHDHKDLVLVIAQDGKHVATECGTTWRQIAIRREE